MTTFLNHLGFAPLAWLIVINHIIHLLEEAPRFVSWANERLNQGGLRYNQKKFNLENALLLALGLIAAVLINVYPTNWFLQVFVLGGAIGFLLNTYFHASHTLRSAIYSPGLVTACLFNPALFVLIFWKASQIGLLTIPNLLVALALGISMLPLAVILTHRAILRNER